MRYKIYSEDKYIGFESKRLEIIIQGDGNVLDAEIDLILNKLRKNNECTRTLHIIVEEATK